MPRFDRPVSGMFYWDDFRTDPIVMLMSSASVGIYMRLLCAAWFQPVPCTLPMEPKLLARLAQTTQEELEICWPEIKGAFAQVDGVFVQKRLQETYKKANNSMLNNRARQQKWEENQRDRELTVSKRLDRRFPSGSVYVSSSVSNNSNTSEKRSRAHEGNGFERFWEVWPNRVEKLRVQKWFQTHHPNDDLVDLMLKAIEIQKKGDKWQKGYIPNPTTWLNAGRWEDEVKQQQSLEERVKARLEDLNK